jgi:uncharacterized protein Yka (UPF0111/DUF47 family)
MKDTCKAAERLEDLMLNYIDIETKIAAIEVIEHVCDNHVHNMMEQLITHAKMWPIFWKVSLLLTDNMA